MCTYTHELGDSRSGTETGVFPEAVMEEWPGMSLLGSSVRY